jgi:hypothetical protein
LANSPEYGLFLIINISKFLRHFIMKIFNHWVKDFWKNI